MKKNIFSILLFCFCIFSSNITLAQESKSKSLEGIEFLTGFSWGRLRVKGHYRLIPILFDFDFNLKPLIRKLNFNPKQLVQFQIEPFISFVFEPDSNVETGVTFLFKTGILPQSSKFQPYLKAGVGVVYMSQHTREQGTQFNFTEQGGLGMHYYLRKNTAFTFEGRIRHLSNSGRKDPNSGINTYIVVSGISYRF